MCYNLSRWRARSRRLPAVILAHVLVCIGAYVAPEELQPRHAQLRRERHHGAASLLERKIFSEQHSHRNDFSKVHAVFERTPSVQRSSFNEDPTAKSGTDDVAQDISDNPPLEEAVEETTKAEDQQKTSNNAVTDKDKKDALDETISLIGLFALMVLIVSLCMLKSQNEERRRYAESMVVGVKPEAAGGVPAPPSIADGLVKLIESRGIKTHKGAFYKISPEDFDSLFASIGQGLDASVTLVGYLTSIEAATAIFAEGSAGIRAGADGLGVITTSPGKLGWIADGKEPWPQNVGAKVWGGQADEVLPGGAQSRKLEVLILLGISSDAIAAGAVEGLPDIAKIPLDGLVQVPPLSGVYYLPLESIQRVCLLKEGT